jgi:hypothetical protein
MRKITIGLAAAASLCASVAVAQEHWTEGPVWECSSYRTNPGMFDAYLKYIRAHVEPMDAEAKKQGLIVDYKTFVKTPSSPDDYDVMFCTAHANFGKALDYNQGDSDKFDAISAAHWATSDKDKQADLTKPRLEMRTFLGSTYIREVNLRPAK